MVGGALITGLALHPFTQAAPFIGGVVGMMAGAAWAYGRVALRLVAAVLAATAVLIAIKTSATLTPTALWLAVASSLVALGMAVGSGRADHPRGIKGAMAVGLTAFVTLLGVYCAHKFSIAREMSKVPPLALTGISAAAMGMVGVLTVLPRHLSWASDPVMAAVKKLPLGLESEVKSLCDRSLAIWIDAKDALADEGGKALVRDGVLKTLEVAAKSVEVKVTGPTDAELSRRMTELDHKVAATTDPEAKTQYQAARAALDDQHRYREHIVKGRERLVARMHNHVAALEKFQLAAHGLEAAKHANSSSPAMKQLEELSLNVEASGEALAEIEMGEAPARMMATAGVIEVVETAKTVKTVSEPDAESGAMA